MMEKHLIRIVSIILIIIVVFSVPTYAESSGNVINDAVNEATDLVIGTPNDDNEATTEGGGESTAETGKKFEDYNDNEKVAVLYICTQQRGLGHAWIYVESLVDCEIPVGCYTLKPNCGVSIGTFSVRGKNGPGVYYNIESYRDKNGKPFKNPRWLKAELSKEKLLKVNKNIKTANYWDIYFNCTFFAARIWNVASRKKVIPVIFPLFISWQISTFGATKDVAFKSVKKEDCYKQRGTGKKAYIVNVKDGTLD